MTKLALIVAANAFGGIGFKGDLPWRLEGDLAQFKEKTLGQVVIIGRNTDQSIPRKGQVPENIGVPRSPLPGRIVITVSTVGQGCTEVADDYWFAPSFEAAVSLAKGFVNKEVFFAGGKRIYEAALPLVDKVYLTHVYRHDPCDVFVDGFDFHAQDDWVLSNSSAVVTHVHPEDGRRYPSHGYHEFTRRIAK